MMRNTVFVGGGPGGLSPLISALQAGRFDALVEQGVTVVERGERLGAGTIGRYAINSDSAAETFISCIDGDPHERFAALRDLPLIRDIRAMRGQAIPLRMVGALMDLLGEAIADMIRDAGGEVLTGHEALSVQQRADGTWSVRVQAKPGQVRAGGPVREILARNVVLATGGHQPAERLTTEPVAGVPLSPRYDATLVQSGESLTQPGLDRIADVLEDVAEPRIVVVGGSTSAVSAAHALLYRLPRSHLGDGAITILHRRELRVFYVTPAEAEADGYLEFGPDDICPVSGRVFRFAGLRFDSRELVMRARGIGGRPPEPRLRLQRLRDGADPEAHALLDGAHVIVAALGYRPHALPVLDLDGLEIALHAHGDGLPPLVDEGCRVMDAGRRPLAGLFAIGLAAGFQPRGELGGEASFVGQQNGLWLWQNAVGGLVVDGLLASETEVAPRELQAV
jgi:hypothetical protein